MAAELAEALLETKLQVEETTEAYIPVRPHLKEQAEAVLNSLGFELSDAVNIFLHRVIVEGGMPAGLPRPLLSMDVMTPEQLGAEIQKGLDDLKAGRTITLEELEAEFERDYGIRI